MAYFAWYYGAWICCYTPADALALTAAIQADWRMPPIAIDLDLARWTDDGGALP